MSMSRADGLIVNQEFFVTQLFDKDGYNTAVTGLCQDDVVAKAYKKTHAMKSLIACSIIFEGSWKDGIPDVSLPPGHKAELAVVDKGRQDD